MAFIAAVALVLTVVAPFAGSALATHPATCSMEVLQEVDSNPTGTTHTLTAVLFAGSTGNSTECDAHAFPVQIDFEVESGPAIRACTPDLATGQCPGGPGQPATGTAVGNEEGNTPQQPDLTCEMPTTGGLNAQTRCSVHFTSDAVGTNLIRAWIDEDRSDGTVEADATEGRYSGPTDCTGADANPRSDPPTTGPNSCTADENGNPLTPVPGQPSEPDITDVVQKTWTQTVTGPVCVDVDPNTDVNPSGTDHTVTMTVTNQAARTASTTEDASEDTCSGAGSSPRGNVTAQFELTGDEPNAFFVTVNGQSTNPSGGTPNLVTCTTTLQGTCTAVIRTVSPAALGTNSITGSVPGSSSGTNQTETVTKEWVSASAVTRVDASPEEDTNPIGTAHIVTATARNALDQGLANVLITFDVTSGVSQNRDNDNNVATPPGFIGQCTTTSSGSCSASYTGAVTGDDTITACRDANADFQCASGTEANSGNSRLGDADDDQVLKHWVAVGQGPAAIALDMEACNGNLSSPSDASWDTTASANGVSNDRQNAHAVCAAVFSSANVVTRTRVTFTIVSGPGRFIVPSTTSATFTEGSNRDLGTSVTTEPGTCSSGATNAEATTTGTGTGTGSYNCAFVLSQATGDTSVRACIEGTLICRTGTKPWTGESPARHLVVTPEADTNLPGTNHEFTAKLTDRFGNPVANQTISWSRTGEGFVVSQETTTNADGQAKLVVRSDVVGTTTVSATMTSQTNCVRAAGDPTGAAAGTCTDTATKTWSEAPQTQCADGDDNDGDGEIDFPDDPGCSSAEDDDETDSPPSPRACRNRGPDENVIVGTAGPDVLNGTGGRDVICGAGGDDVINGRGGNDLIVGNGGSDTISGGPGKDNLSGNKGRDSISGNSGNDAIKGNAGNDTLNGNAGNDELSGNRGKDAVKGNGGNDTLRGNAGIDTLTGGGGADTLSGGDGQDILRGGSGNDTLRGGPGADALNGGDGRDRCFGGPGRDSVRKCE